MLSLHCEYCLPFVKGRAADPPHCHRSDEYHAEQYQSVAAGSRVSPLAHFSRESLDDLNWFKPCATKQLTSVSSTSSTLATGTSSTAKAGVSNGSPTGSGKVNPKQLP